MRRAALILVALVACLAVAPATLAAPGDGNGKKFVVTLDEDVRYDCGSEFINLHIGGWFQGTSFQGNGNRNVELAVYHIVLTFTNAAGDTFRYVDVGPDHAYWDRDGNFVVTITGRPSNVNADGFALNGHAVVVNGDLTWYAGRAGPIAEDQACAALT
jgi:hypothetical protein